MSTYASFQAQIIMLPCKQRQQRQQLRGCLSISLFRGKAIGRDDGTSSRFWGASFMRSDSICRSVPRYAMRGRKSAFHCVLLLGCAGNYHSYSFGQDRFLGVRNYSCGSGTSTVTAEAMRPWTHEMGLKIRGQDRSQFEVCMESGP